MTAAIAFKVNLYWYRISISSEMAFVFQQLDFVPVRPRLFCSGSIVVTPLIRVDVVNSAG